MVKNNYIKIIDGVYLNIRDNAVNGIYNYYINTGTNSDRKSARTRDYNKAMIIAIHAYQQLLTNPNKVKAAAKGAGQEFGRQC